ncbi:uncharacterized protein LOC120265040 [Dioscorea cayenensis subsp. rotundata]|uniref:Uncharacterized protein LOC120265040 n=1 Tax=Dioscorea cayennensis subsp. rotundata TaxID=55577 RepID=A0AB40BNE2_DIOCR|nr:uncharacterized protein LOC120265040 [Dioscorea cayenensis subsp. rotundata]
MASSSASAPTPDISHTLLPVFRGEGYEHWSYMMKTLFRSQRLWKVIEEGISAKEPTEKELEDDAKILFLLQQPVDETILHRIVRFDSAKEAWDHIKNENQGTSRMVSVKQQTLRQRFDLLQMKEGEIVQHYITRVLSVVMRSLSSRFVHALTSIEEARDMSKVTLDELSGSLQAHESKFNQDAFVMQGDLRGGRTNWRGKGTFGGLRGRGRSGDNSRGGDQRPSIQRQQNFSESSRLGSREFGRYSRGSSSNVPNLGDYGHLFMVHNGQEMESPSIWLLDSGTSSHITGRRELFHNLDETLQHKVGLGDDKRGQLNEGGYDVNFSKNYGCIIRDGSTGRILFRI